MDWHCKTKNKRCSVVELTYIPNFIYVHLLELSGLHSSFECRRGFLGHELVLDGIQALALQKRVFFVLLLRHVLHILTYSKTIYQT